MRFPMLQFPGVSQADFEEAFAVLRRCRIDDPSPAGLEYPFFAPGGGYGPMWWQIDSSLALGGWKWIDPHGAENAVRNFLRIQKPDGRIPLYQPDTLPDSPHHSRQREGVSSLPKLFGIAYAIAERSEDESLVREIYQTLAHALSWWFEARQDRETGLISAVFEECFPPYLGQSGEYAPPDTNMEVALGCYYAFWLADALGLAEEKMLFLRKCRQLQDAVNRYLWDEESGAYYPYLLRERRLEKVLLASTFRVLSLDCAPPDRRARLTALMQEPGRFGWERFPLTSAAMTDPTFTITRGAYQYNASWSGGVWTLLNEGVVQSLLDAGEDALGAALALKTVRAFCGNYAEYLSPDDGAGQGVREYAWSASQFLTLLIEVIFGVRFSRLRDTLFIDPHPDVSLYGQTIVLRGLTLPEGSVLDLEIDCAEEPAVRYTLSETAEMKICIRGEYVRGTDGNT